MRGGTLANDRTPGAFDLTRRTLLGAMTDTGGGAAIASAVLHATGKRVRELPITLDRLP